MAHPVPSQRMTILSHRAPLYSQADHASRPAFDGTGSEDEAIQLGVPDKPRGLDKPKPEDPLSRSEHGEMQQTWLDRQQSWLDWAGISFPPGPSYHSNEANVNITEAIPHARWGSDPAFSSVFTAPTTQLSEGEVASIWEEYVEVSLKRIPSSASKDQLLIVGNARSDGDIGGLKRVDSVGFGVQRGPLRPFKPGRKRPMPPRVERGF